MSLILKEAPDFKATTVAGAKIDNSFTLSQYRDKKYVVLFFYPFDFTFVCPTEMHAFQEQLADFEARNVQVIGCSCDSQFSHSAWLNTPKVDGGIQGITYPIIADFDKSIAKAYEVENAANSAAFRGTFIIDKKGVIQVQLVHTNSIGRNVNEIVRMVDALQYAEEHGEVCPANWTKGQKAMKATADGVKAFFKG